MMRGKEYAVQAPGRPTFYLKSNVQGITSPEHAKRIAAQILEVAPRMITVEAV